MSLGCQMVMPLGMSTIHASSLIGISASISLSKLSKVRIRQARLELLPLDGDEHLIDPDNVIRKLKLADFFDLKLVRGEGEPWQEDGASDGGDALLKAHPFEAVYSRRSTRFAPPCLIDARLAVARDARPSGCNPSINHECAIRSTPAPMSGPVVRKQERRISPPTRPQCKIKLRERYNRRNALDK